jgi:hypothetical protein
LAGDALPGVAPDDATGLDDAAPLDDAVLVGETLGRNSTGRGALAGNALLDRSVSGSMTRVNVSRPAMRLPAAGPKPEALCDWPGPNPLREATAVHCCCEELELSEETAGRMARGGRALAKVGSGALLRAAAGTETRSPGVAEAVFQVAAGCVPQVVPDVVDRPPQDVLPVAPLGAVALGGVAPAGLPGADQRGAVAAGVDGFVP